MLRGDEMDLRDARRGASRLTILSLLGLAAATLLFAAGCATRPVNPSLARVDPEAGYRFTIRERPGTSKENLIVLAFSGGGTRAAAFAYGVLEALRPLVVIGPKGNRARLIDEVDLVTGVSGGSFTALAFALYGEHLFDIYEPSFLKRDVQGELILRLVNPAHWGDWGRSETAADLYDEILFHGATFADLERGHGPFVVASATDISTGARVGFNQGTFDFLCSNLDPVRLSRAAAASSAVPFAFSPVTLNNYGGTCEYTLPPFLGIFSDPASAPRPAARVLSRLADLRSYADSAHRPYVHLLDGGLSDNLGMRGVLEVLDTLEASSVMGQATPLDSVRRIIVFVVNSRSSPTTNWDASERPPGSISLLIKATGVPIDHYSYDTVETLRDTVARWDALRRIRESRALAGNTDPEVARLLRAPDVRLYAIDVSFAALDDPAEREYLNNLPTSFVLPPEAIDRLRAAAGRIVRASPEFRRLLEEAGARIVEE
jgi:NTE family protein